MRKYTRARQDHRVKRPKQRTRRLSAILVQYDRQKYSGAVERLVALLESLETVDYRLVVVDNANPGGWSHEVSRRIVHAGGDNSAWEFSGFDRGLACLRGEIESDLFVFATDAFLAWGDDYLELIDDRTVEQCLELEACAGWTDSFQRECTLLGYAYNCWLRSSFLWMPADAVRRIRPLEHRFDPRQFFGPSAAAPFLPTAPLNDTLKSQILGWLTTHAQGRQLDEAWHSRFELDDDTLEKFQRKSLAIFREHLLSARLREVGIPCYDFRLLRLLDENGTTRRRFATRKAEWQWLGWMNDPGGRQPHHELDVCELPRVVDHGEPATILIIGWVLSDPPAREVRLELSDGQTFTAYCDQPRPDVIAENPEFDHEVCGFKLELSPCLPVGDYGARLAVPRASVDVDLGSIHVRKRLAFEPTRQFFATAVAPGARLPVCLEGELESTDPLRAIRATLDGEPAPEDLRVDFGLSRRPSSGIHRYSVSLFGGLDASAEERRHVLELTFETEAGDTHSWSRRFLVEKNDSAPHALTRRQIGAYDPRVATTSVEIEGSYWNARQGDRVVLRRDGERVLAADAVLFAGTRDGETPVASFHIARRAGGLPPGPGDFDLAVERKDLRIDLTSWRQTIDSFAPEIHVDELDVEPDPSSAGRYTVRIVGYVANTFLVDALSFFLDGQICTIAGVDRLHPTLKQRPGQGTVILQGFRIETPVEAAPGEHQLRIAVTQSYGQPAEWRRHVLFEPHDRVDFRLISADLAALASGRQGDVLPPITIAATVFTELTSVVADLHGDGELVDQCRVESGRELDLRWIPPSPGRHLIRVDVKSRGRSLYDSGDLRVDSRVPEVSRELRELVVSISAALGLQSHLRIDLDELMLRLIKRELPRLPELAGVLRRLARRLRGRGAPATPQALDLDRLPPAPLRILFVAWEVPCLRHGGGVCMLNLLKRLSRRHRVTLIHSFGVDEQGWAEEARPAVDRLISVPRDYHEARYVTDPGLPEVYRNNYTPELRAAIQRELLVTDYDLVNYEYLTVFPHVVSTPAVPSVLVVHEMPTAAKRTTYFKNPSIATHVDQLRDYLKTAYFLAETVPAEIDHLITLTESDAGELLELGPRASVYVNKIGVDCGDLAPPEGREPAGDAPTLVFLGNFRHTPNQQAALDFGTRVMPRVHQRHRQARFLVIGGFVPEALRALDGHHGTEILGFVDDFRPYLWDATAFVAPLTTGAGMRVKVLEALACGAPVVATPLAMEGLEATAGRHYLEAETAGEVAEACCRLIRDRSLRRELGREGLALARSTHDWPVRVREREAIWQQAIESHAAAGKRVATESPAVKS